MPGHRSLSVTPLTQACAGGDLRGVLGIHTQCFADGIEVAACNVVQAAKVRGGGFKVPVPIPEDPGVCPGANDLADKQVISRLVVRFVQQFAGEPRRTARNEGQIMAGQTEQLDTALRQFVRSVEQAHAANVAGQFELAHGWNLNHENATVLYQSPRPGNLVQHHSHFWR